jgi:C1A family cysteine protease
MKARLLTFGLAGIAVLIMAVAVAAQTPVVAPPRPGDPPVVTERTGFVPPDWDLSHLSLGTPSLVSKGVRRHGATTAGLPERWDWREQGKVSPVKHQWSCGCCFAFASMGNVESRLLIDLDSLYDLSENNAKECSYGSPSCSGGDFFEVANLLSQYGTVLESCDPYVAADVSCNSGCDYGYTLQDWRVINTDSVPAHTLLQDYIYLHGPIYSSVYASTEAFDSYDGSTVIYDPSNPGTDHAIMIIGWDDTLSHAGGQGAWICKNSWGTGWGGTCGYGTEGGYFYIAYGSLGIGSWSSYAYHLSPYDDSQVLLAYDEAGWTGQFGLGALTAWGLVAFTPAADVDITQVEIWTTDATTDIDVDIYADFGGSTPSTLLNTKHNTSFTEAGYHTITLDSVLSVTAGEDIYVVVKITNASYNMPMAYDASGPRESGKMYFSHNGSSWTDIYGSGINGDLTIRARGNSCTPSSPPTPQSPSDGASDLTLPVTVEWAAVSGGVNYVVEIDTLAAFTGPSVSDTTTHLQREFTEAVANTTYYWRLKVETGCGWSDWCTTQSFSTGCGLATPGIPALLAPANDTTGLPTSMQLHWTVASDAASYQVQVDVDSSFSSPILDTSTALLIQELTSLQQGAMYVWRVRAINACDTGSWSDTWDFTTACPPPGAPVLVSPADGAVDLPLPVTVTWGSVSGATGYALEVDSVGDFVSPVISENLGDVSLELSGLIEGVTYYWRVHATNGCGSGAWSDPYQFTTLSIISGILDDNNGPPNAFNLSQNYPNPFNSSTVIEFTLPRPTHVDITVFNISGQQVATVASRQFSAGYHQVSWTAAGLASGVYFYRLTMAGESQTLKMLLLK